MPELQTKLQNELSQEAMVVACRFPFPGWRHTREIGAGVDTVWTYRPNDPS